MGVESLESRALLTSIVLSGGNSNAAGNSNGASGTGIIASAVISETPAAGVYDYSIALANSSQSGTAIGSFWYAWTPGQDYLSTYPISVSAPAGWTAQVTSGGGGDGYGIQFVANTSSNDIQPGSSLSFSFISTDPPSSVEGNSQFYSGVPVGTSAVYPAAAINDGGTPFVVSASVTLASIAVTPASSSVPNGATDPFDCDRDVHRQLDTEPHKPGQLDVQCALSGDDLRCFGVTRRGYRCGTGNDHHQRHDRRGDRLHACLPLARPFSNRWQSRRIIR